MVYVFVNSEAASFYQSQTDNWINSHPTEIICNDYVSQSVSNGAVRLQFQPSNQRPVFVAINGVAGSPSHAQWELLVNDGRYGDTDFSTELANYRNAIDAVQPPLARLVATHAEAGEIHLQLISQPGTRLQLEGSTDLNDWTQLRSLTNHNGTLIFSEPAGMDYRFYRAVQTTNSIGPYHGTITH